MGKRVARTLATLLLMYPTIVKQRYDDSLNKVCQDAHPY